MNDNLKKVSPEMRKLLLLKLKRAQTAKAAIPKKARTPGSNSFPLSFAQSRLWFLERYLGSSAVYSTPGQIHLKGEVDLTALEKALNQVVERHEILRTRYPSLEEIQLVDPFEPFSLELEDLREQADPQETASERRLQEARLPFDLEKGPIFRAFILQLAHQEYRLILNMHHIATDAWSTNILMTELQQCYEAFQAGREPELPELAVQYGDYAAWHRNLLTGEVLEKRLAFWRENLADAPVLELQYDRPRPAQQTFEGRLYSFSFASSLMVPLKELAQAEGVTLFVVLLAAYQTLLYRYTGQQDLVVGVPFANRNRSETQKMIGFFINTLPLRAYPKGEHTFRTLLKEQQANYLDVQNHQDLPFEKLVDALGVDRNSSHPPLYQVTFNYVNMVEQGSSTPHHFSYEEVFTNTSKFDISLALGETTESIRGEIAYNPELLEPTTVDRMVRHFTNLLRAIASDPDVQLTGLAMLDEREQEQLVSEQFGRLEPEPGPPTSGCIHSYFEKQAARTPEAIALTNGDQHISYAQLECQSNQLAWHLIKHGVGPERRVGICLTRSPRLIYAILAVLKAGAVYVPLDPNYPEDRLSFITQDAELAVTLIEHDSKAHFSSEFQINLDLLDLRQQPPTSPTVSVDEANGAYLIYTSGSTGKPKGVLIPHKGVPRLFAATRKAFAFSEKDVWTLYHSYSFDFTVWEIWGALFHGGRLVLVPYEVARTPEAFHALLAREKVTMLSQSPSAFRQLIHYDASSETALPALRHVIFGAEALELNMLEPWYAKHGAQIEMVNMYGITETTVHVTCRPIKAHESTLTSPIGKAISDLQIYIHDQGGNPVPVGVPGEVFVGGAGLARGYLKRPALTAQRFMPHPYASQAGQRLYRSGDRACYSEDGTLIYLGRVDQQVKVRGYRIEPGEIQVAIANLPGVRDTIVLPLKDEQGATVLVAYVVAHSDADLRVNALRDSLTTVLPDYMVPGRFCFLDSLPITTHGKLDYRALPGLAEIKGEAGTDLVALETPTEETLAAVWSRGLGGVQVGRDDNFFNLGGDSIRSIRVLALAQKHELHFDLQQLFRYPTVKRLAQEIDRSRMVIPTQEPSKPFELISASIRSELPNEIIDAYPMSQLQLGMLYEMTLDTEHTAYHNVDSFVIEGRLEHAALVKSLQMLAQRHPIYRTSLHLSGYGEPLQLVHREGVPDLTWIDWRKHGSAKQDQLVQAFLAEEQRRLFEITKPGLIRFTVHQLASQRYRFTLTECHPILDGWSLTASLTELFTRHFKIILEGDETPLPPPRLSYRDFVRDELEAMESETMRSFWMNRLGDFTMVRLPQRPQLPGSRESGTNQVIWEIPKQRVDALKAVARTARVPLKTVFLAAHFKILNMLTARSDVLTGLQSNGRADQDGGDEVVGLFLNAMPTRMVMKPGTWIELVQQTFQAEWEVLPYRRYPMAKIQNEHGGPLFESFFNYVSFHSAEAFLRSEHFKRVDDAIYLEPNHFPLFNGFNLNPIEGHVIAFLQSLHGQMSKQQLLAIQGYLETIFDALIAAIESGAPATTHSQNLISEQERARILDTWNDTEIDYGKTQTLTEHITNRASKTPDALAVVFGEEQLNYAQLMEQAISLANQLRERGIGTGHLVGVCLERSSDMVVSLLGTLLAGAAYVPLDPTNPSKRLSLIAQDAQISQLITSQSHQDLEFIAESKDVLFTETATTTEKTAPLLALDSFDLAYMIYTSGSTGKPKGVMNSHGAITNRLLWMAEYLGTEPADRFVQKTPFSFDVSVWEFFLPLISGARLVVCEPEKHKDSVWLRELIRAQGITVIHFVPSMLGAFLEQHDLEGMESLKHVICSGEALPPAMVTHSHRRLKATLHNFYGPTEAAVDVTYYETTQEAWPGLVPIGKPIANTELYVLDEMDQPVILGTGGHLHLSGAGLARGYHHQPGLTAERFVPHPYTKTPGARLYKTGDLVRYLEDGNVDYQGRIDTQVKIRGFRVETGEIQVALERHESVRQAAVLVRRNAQDQATLVAYLVCGPEPPEAQALREHLLAYLPDYMVPAHYSLLERFPMTQHGKLDTRSLPDLEALTQSAQAQYALPQTPMEELLAAIFGEVLKIDKIGRDDDFLALGGDSILSLRVVAMAEKHGVTFSIQQLQANPIIKNLAIKIDMGLEVDKQPEPIGPFELISAETRKELPTDVVDAYPVTKAQLGMIFHMRMEPELLPYHNVDCALFEGAIEKEAFLEACRIVVERHPCLRTSLHLIGYDQPLQLVHEQAQMRIVWEDLRGMDEAVQQETIKAFFEAEVNTPFELEKAPLVRFSVHLLEGLKFQYTMTENHALMDGWSFNALFTEMFDLCFKIIAQEQIAEPDPLQIAYRDFVNQEMIATASPEHRGFWEHYLKDNTRFAFPVWDQEKPSEDRNLLSTYHGYTAEQASQLKRISHHAGTPFKSVLLAAHIKALSLLSNQDDITTGIVASGRPEVEGGDRIYGLFFNVMPFRVGLQQGTWLDLVRQTFDSELQTIPHRRVPLAVIQEAHGSEPLFETMFNFISFHTLKDVYVPGRLKFHKKQYSKDPTHFPLGIDFNLDPVSGELIMILQSTSPRIDQEHLERIRDYYRAVIEAMLESLGNGGRDNHHQMNVLGQEEQWHLLETLNNEAGKQVMQPLPLQFEANCRQRPGEIAVAFGDHILTYSQLAARVNQVSYWLLARGVGVGTMVAICMERRPDMLVAMVAVQRTGAAFVPLDPAYPQERIEQVLEDSGAQLMLTYQQEGTLAGTPQQDLSRMPWDGLPTSPPLCQVPMEATAYVIFTSGSTGRPKGVRVGHRAIANLLNEMARYPGIDSNCRLLAVSTITFDIAVLELFQPLWVGGQTVIATREQAGDANALVSLIEEHQINLLQATPVTWRMILASGWQGDQKLRIFSGGEAMHGELATRLAALGSEVWNLYGPTETTIYAALHQVDTQQKEYPSIIALGRPLAFTALYVMSRSLYLLPRGVAGELMISGAGLAEGYHNGPGKTAEAFIPHPYAKQPGERLYRSGDMVRRLDNGNIDYLGRIDHQVKLRGYRIELGEIETVIGKHEQVSRVVAILREDVVGEMRITAYVVPNQGEPIEIATLETYIRQKLPEYMTPTAWVSMESLPLTTSGKIDRKALPSPEGGTVTKRPEYVAPRHETETDLAKFYAELFGLDQVGIHDDFFALGGHSLTATQLMVKLNQHFQINMPLRTLFDYATVAQLAQQVEHEQIGEVEADELDELLAEVDQLTDEDLSALVD